MDNLCEDIIRVLLPLLDFRAFIAVSLTNRSLAILAATHVTDNNLLARGYGKMRSFSNIQSELIAAYTCPCGMSSWNALTGCDCWVECEQCPRRLPSRLIRRGRCKFPCMFHCRTCLVRVTTENVSDFHFTGYNNLSYCNECIQIYPINRLPFSITRWEDAKLILSSCFGNYERMKDIVICEDPLNPLISLLFLFTLCAYKASKI